MSEPQIVCPKCRTTIRLTDTVAAPLLAQTRKQFEQQLAQKEAGLAKQQAALRRAQDALTDTRNAMDHELAQRLRRERVTIAKAEARKARLLLAGGLTQRDRQLRELQDHLNANAAKLAQAQKAQAEVMRKSRELDDAKRELDLQVEDKVQASLAKVRSTAKAEAEAHLKAKVLEKEAQIAGMQRQIELLRRKADQSSQQLQGEAFEQQVEALLRQQFPQDLFEPVRVGAPGGDLLHRVRNPAGRLVGAMLWECKQARSWSNRWLAKLRDDQRTAKADIALIVSPALPKDTETFARIDNVWITAPRFALPLATMLRQSLIDLAGVRLAADDRHTKMEMVYRYLTSPEFHRQMEATIETFADMQTDLDRERRTTMRLWAKREAQLNAVINASASFYGDLQGIAGQAMPEIKSLNPIVIEDKSSLTAAPAPTSTRSVTKPSTPAACPVPSRNPPSGMDS